MPYTKDFTFDDIEEECVIRDTLDNEVQIVGKYVQGEGWHIFPESINAEAYGVGFYVPDNRWPGRYELQIED